MAVILADGAVGSPSVTFANDGSLGIYRASAGVMSISGVGSVQIASFSATSIGLRQDVTVADGKYIYQDDVGGIGNNSRARQYVDYTGGGSGYGGTWYLDTRTSSNSWVNAIQVNDQQQVGIGTGLPISSLSVNRINGSTLSGTGNTFGIHIYPVSSGYCYFDAINGSTSNSSLALRTYNNTVYTTVLQSISGNETTFGRSGAEAARFTSGGNFNIGGTPASAPYHVLENGYTANIGLCQFRAMTGLLAQNGTADLTLPVNFCGHVYLSNTYAIGANTRTNAVYFVAGRLSNNVTITLLNSANGTTSGCSFTLTSPADNTLRFTNTQGGGGNSSYVVTYVGISGG